ncbi:hypothetical protein EDC04DRAFT_2680131 [Pisolithus marmoratus]|nr:hypothetical protein EDC04DRAFT_2680131 [Pisolithus marmoratus]
MSSSRYFRLMGLAAIEVLGKIPIGAYIIYLNWISWANTHYDFSRVAQYPSVVWHVNHQMAVSLQMSLIPARRNYRLAYTSFAKKVGISTGTMSSGTWGTGSKQDMSYNSRPGDTRLYHAMHRYQQDSFASLSTNLSIGDLGNPNLHEKKQPYSATTSGGSISKDSLPTAAAAMDVPIDFNDITAAGLP